MKLCKANISRIAKRYGLVQMKQHSKSLHFWTFPECVNFYVICWNSRQNPERLTVVKNLYVEELEKRYELRTQEPSYCSIDELEDYLKEIYKQYPAAKLELYTKMQEKKLETIKKMFK